MLFTWNWFGLKHFVRQTWNAWGILWKFHTPFIHEHVWRNCRVCMVWKMCRWIDRIYSVIVRSKLMIWYIKLLRHLVEVCKWLNIHYNNETNDSFFTKPFHWLDGVSLVINSNVCARIRVKLGICYITSGCNGCYSTNRINFNRSRVGVRLREEKKCVHDRKQSSYIYIVATYQPWYWQGVKKVTITHKKLVRCTMYIFQCRCRSTLFVTHLSHFVFDVYDWQRYIGFV